MTSAKQPSFGTASKTARKKYGVPKGAVVLDMGSAIMVHAGDADRTCAYLVDGRCSIYDDRPSTCRRYGLVPALPCLYLYPDEARKSQTRMRMFASLGARLVP